MNAIDRVKSHWSERLTEVREIKVPEWGDADGPLIIHVKPTNMAQRSRLFKLAQEGSLMAVAETLILRARDKDGLPIFTGKDAETLMKEADPDVVTRVAGEINGDMGDLTKSVEGEDAEKK